MRSSLYIAAGRQINLDCSFAARRSVPTLDRHDCLARSIALVYVPPAAVANGEVEQVSAQAWVHLNPELDIRRQLLDASRDRQLVVCGDATGRLKVPADDLSAALIGAGAYGVRLVGAQVTGRLDLQAAVVPGPLHLFGCSLEEAPMLEGAELHELVIASGDRLDPALPWTRTSTLPGLLAGGVRIKRDLVLSGTTVRGAHYTSASLTKSSAIWLTEAHIGGRLLAIGTVIEATGDRAMQCDRMSVTGDVRLVRGFTATGEVRLLAVRLGGSLDLTAATLRPANFRALDAAEATVGGSIFILDDPDLGWRPRIDGRIEFARSVVAGQILIRNADLRSPLPGAGLHDYNAAERDGNPVLIAPRLSVAGEFALEHETVVHGGIVLAGADLKGGLRADKVRLWNAGGTALDLSQASLGTEVRLVGALVEGTVSVANARIGGPLDVSAAHLRRPAASQRCIDGVGVSVEGDVRMTGLDVRGGNVNFRGARLNGVIEAEAASIENPGGKTLSLHQARVSGNVRLCKGFHSVGVVVLNRAIIEGRLRCDDAKFSWPGPPTPDNRRCAAVEAISATFRSGLGLGWTIVAGSVDLTDTQTTFLADRPGEDWPPQAFLSGFSYRRYDAPDNEGGPGAWDADTRIRWLAGLRPFDPGSWGQVARVLQDNGDHGGAEKVLIARARQIRRQRGGLRHRPLRLLADLVLDLFAGYGHRPLRALGVLFLLIGVVGAVLAVPTNEGRMRAAAGGVVYSPTTRLDPSPGPARCGDGTVRCFNPWFYAVDTVVPVLDLKQRSTWHLDTADGGWWLDLLLNICTMLGWTASTVFLLTFTRLGRAGP